MARQNQRIYFYQGFIGLRYEIVEVKVDCDSVAYPVSCGVGFSGRRYKAYTQQGETMTEGRKSPISFSKRFAKNGSKKTTKIELFPAHLYAEKWSLYDRKSHAKFYPKPPLHGQNRKDYWEGRFRVSIDGIVVEGKAKYTLFTKEQIFKRWLDF